MIDTWEWVLTVFCWVLCVWMWCKTKLIPHKKWIACMKAMLDDLHGRMKEELTRRGNSERPIRVCPITRQRQAVLAEEERS